MFLFNGAVGTYVTVTRYQKQQILKLTAIDNVLLLGFAKEIPPGLPTSVLSPKTDWQSKAKDKEQD